MMPITKYHESHSVGVLDNPLYQTRTRGVLSTVIRVVMGTLSAILLKLKDKLNAIGVDTSVALIQKRALLGSARILERQIFDN